MVQLTINLMDSHNSNHKDSKMLSESNINDGSSKAKTKAKQKASLKWLCSKAHNNRTPEEFADPFYKDHTGEEHLKPFIIKGLSDAELYCLALCNMYADPNYSQLSPMQVVQVLARKGVYVQNLTDIQLTETVLIQNTPLKITAHMPIVESMMILQVKEIISNAKVVNSVQKFGPNVHSLKIWYTGDLPSDPEEAMLLWINRAVLAIKEYTQNNNAQEHNLTGSQIENWNQLPLFQDLSDLSDGVGLCSLLAFYCQDELSLNEITIPSSGELLNASESLWNIQLVNRVCRDSLHNVCHFTLEDILYFNNSMKQNMLSFLADLFNQLELNPSPNIKLLGSNQIIPIRPGLTSDGLPMRRNLYQQKENVTIPDLRPSLYNSASTFSDRNSVKSQQQYSQSATTTPKRTNNTNDRSRKYSSSNIQSILDPQSGRKSPSNASVLSVPIKRPNTPQDNNDKSHSDRSNHKEQRFYANSSDDSEEFVVHRGRRNVPTLSQVIRSISPSSQEERSSPASRFSMSRNTSVNENDDNSKIAAGRPSNWSANKTSYAGRRSRRNSFSDTDSQLTIENFGGSQDNLNRFQISKNPDKQPAVLDSLASPVRYPRRQSSQEPPDYNYDTPPSNSNSPSLSQSNNYSSSANKEKVEQSKCINTINSNDYGSNDKIFYGRKKFNHIVDEINENFLKAPSPKEKEFDDSSREEKQLLPKFQTRSSDPYNRQQSDNSNVTVYVMNNERDLQGFGDAPYRSTSMSNLSRLSDLQNQNKPVNIVYLQQQQMGNPPNNNIFGNGNNYDNNNETSWATKTQEYQTMPASYSNRGSYYSSPPQQQQTFVGNHPAQINYLPQQTNNEEASEDDTDEIASQLASIRLKLEEKRKRIEMEKGRIENIASKQQSKIGKAAYLKAINKGKCELNKIDAGAGKIQNPRIRGDSLDKPGDKTKLSLKDLESKWLAKTDEPCRTPEIENMDLETYQRNLAKMDTSLSELESDINKLSFQQEKIQRNFFLHGDSNEATKRKTWATSPNNNNNNNNNNPSSNNRLQWSTPKLNQSESSQPFNGDLKNSSSPQYSSSTKPQIPEKPANLSSGNSSFRLHSNPDSQGNRLFSKPSELENENPDLGVSATARPTPPPRQSRANLTHAPLPTPPPDDMEPQSVSFVNDDNVPSTSSGTSISSKKSSIQNITSGSKTYRIENGSPPRPSAQNLFNKNKDGADSSLTSSDENPSINNQGFYIPLDNSNPIKPKPPLRKKSPSKKISGKNDNFSNHFQRRDLTTDYIHSIVDRVPIDADDDDDEGLHNFEEDEMECERTNNRIAIDEKALIDPNELDRMEKKKEQILLLSLRRQQAVEEARRTKEYEFQKKKDLDALKEEEKVRKREEDKARKQAILDSYRMKKQEETMEKDNKWEVQESSAKRFLRPKSASQTRPRPKTIHLSEVDSSSHGVLRRSDSQNSTSSFARSYGKQKGSSTNLYSDAGHNVGGGRHTRSRSAARDPWGSTSSLNQDNRQRQMGPSYARARTRDLSQDSRLEVRSRRDNYLGSQNSLAHNHRHNSTSSLLDGGGGKMSSGAVDSDSGLGSVLGTCSPSQRRTPSPSPTQISSKAPSCSLPSPSGNKGPGSLPISGLISRRRGFDDGSSDISSVTSSNMDYSGLRLFKQPTAKSNRSIILNAVEYSIFPGVVNRDAKMKVLDEINRSDSKHFLIMFRDAGCQFRALYSYLPEREEVIKLYGIGPKQVTDRMFEMFFKYNSGGKCFSKIHTKHLTVTIDAFTIHNAIWQGKRAPTTKTKDMALVI